jgi:hypothetical protein
VQKTEDLRSYKTLKGAQRALQRCSAKGLCSDGYAGVYTIDWSSPCGFEQPVNGWTIEDQGRWLSMVEFVGKDSIVVDWTDNKKGAILMTHSIAKRALDMMSISARARFQKATAQQVAFLPID